MTSTMSHFHRFEIADLLVMLCDAGQTSLAGRIARSLLEGKREGKREGASRAVDGHLATGTPAHREDDGEGASKHLGVASDEAKASSTVQPLECDLPPARRRR